MTPPAAVRARVVPPLAIHQDGASVRIDVLHYDTARARASSADGHSAKVRLYTKIREQNVYSEMQAGGVDYIQRPPYSGRKDRRLQGLPQSASGEIIQIL